MKIAQRQGIYAAAGFGIQNVAAMAAAAAVNGGCSGGGGGGVGNGGGVIGAPFPLFGPCYPSSLCMSMLTTTPSNSQAMVSSTTDVLPTTKSNILTETCNTSTLHWHWA